MFKITFKRRAGPIPEKVARRILVELEVAARRTSLYGRKRLIDAVPKSYKPRVAKSKITVSPKAASLSIALDPVVVYGEFGRRRGARMAPIEVLTEWVMKNGLARDARGARSMAWAIAVTWVKNGKPAGGWLGLAVPGSIPNGEIKTMEPLPSGAVDQIYKRYEREITQAVKVAFQ